MDELILTATVRSTEVTKGQNPAVPYTIDEIVREAKSAYDTGTAVIHVHAREDNGAPTLSKARFKEALDAIYKVIPDMIITPSTGGAVGMTAEERLQPTELMPEMATLDCDTCNSGDDVFENTIPMIHAFGKRIIKSKIEPGYECFEMGCLNVILCLALRGEVPGDPMQFSFVLGIFGCTPATANNLAWLAGNVPASSTWAATSIGRYEFPLTTVAIDMGNHVRIGFEDNLYLSKGVLAKSSDELVAKVTRITRELGREITSPAEARRVLLLAPRH